MLQNLFLTVFIVPINHISVQKRRLSIELLPHSILILKHHDNILLTSNNLVEWLQSEVVHSPDSVSAVGKKIPAAKDSKERYVNSNFHLYASYCSYCEDTGSKPVGQKRFISLLLDCCKNQLGMKEIISFSKKGRPFIKGLVIRNSDEKFKGAVTILPERQS